MRPYCTNTATSSRGVVRKGSRLQSDPGADDAYTEEPIQRPRVRGYREGQRPTGIQDNSTILGDRTSSN
jgi:hypothetical protein